MLLQSALNWLQADNHDAGCDQISDGGDDYDDNAGDDNAGDGIGDALLAPLQKVHLTYTFISYIYISCVMSSMLRFILFTFFTAPPS